MTASPYTATITLTDRRDRRFGWLMAAPSLALLFLVILFPVFWAFFTSLHDYTLIAPNFDTFTGTGNFIKAAEDARVPPFAGADGVVRGRRGAAGVRPRLPGRAGAQQGGALQGDLLRHPAVPAADEPGDRRPHLAHVPAPEPRHRELPAVGGRHRAGQLAGQHQRGDLDHHPGRHLAPGLVHDRAAAGRPVAPCRRSPTRRRGSTAPVRCSASGASRCR